MKENSIKSARVHAYFDSEVKWDDCHFGSSVIAYQINSGSAAFVYSLAYTYLKIQPVKYHILLVFNATGGLHLYLKAKILEQLGSSTVQ